ncbi:NSFL1 cofactor p47-like isoform X2 [Leptotrombidium deliense]|uniref:NSFL1 cofactor p47-like isoform X2 n=1 Tax=Leptotrombidium deliense TaxID=299467 RepID=A0A443SPC8_9ACAR|nr:NSFL1 cofactor p47-like isoform X2 [Leptotrombidium deliense]
MEERDAIVAQFCGVTGVDEERATFYLESANWSLDLATRSFYEQQEEDNEPIDVEMPPMEDKKKQTVKSSAERRIATLNTLNSSSDDEEHGQAFYAGGSEHSGQQMLGPGKKKNPNDMIQSIFNSAKEHGAMADKSAMETEQRGTTNLVLKMWRNGFSVDDGPLRLYEEQDNAQFLQTVSRGEIPRELARNAGGNEINLSLEDHRNEDYVQPKKEVQPFSGKGNRLGAAAPEMTSTTPAVNEPVELKVDESKPVTNVQIRLADGSRIPLKVNLSTTIREIRNHICQLRPQYASQPFVLMTTFPNQQLTEENLTVEEAKLQNALIVQQLK